MAAHRKVRPCQSRRRSIRKDFVAKTTRASSTQVGAVLKGCLPCGGEPEEMQVARTSNANEAKGSLAGNNSMAVVGCRSIRRFCAQLVHAASQL